MRFASVFASAVVVVALVPLPGIGVAQPLGAVAARGAPPPFDARFVLDPGLPEAQPPDPSETSLSFNGEYQLRSRSVTDLRLAAPVQDVRATTLGQNQALTHWLRLSPRFQYRDKLAVVGQIDVLRGLLAGDTTRYVDKARDALAVATWSEVHPRYLYIELSSPIGLFRLGQQGSHWGTGLLANDGEHVALFGDPRRGALVERLLYAATPLGPDAPLTMTVAGDLVFEDNTADLLGDDIEGHGSRYGDRALQAVASVLWRERRGELGLYGVLRRQERTSQATEKLPSLVETLTSGAIDVMGKFNAPVPGAEAYVYGEIEGAVVVGRRTIEPSTSTTPVDAAAAREPEAVRSFGGAATLGAVHTAGRGARRWGRLVTEIEVGYASGDADPHDGVARRFTFDPNHNVGLVLFDHVLAWKTARAATLAQDPKVIARPEPGVRQLASQGGVFGAAYVNPRVVVRPARWLDLKVGALVAQTTVDLVDSYQTALLGSAANYDGGDERRHDLGVELDCGVDARIPMSDLAILQLGAEGGVLFPGHAFDDASGDGLSNQYLLTLKLGLLY